VTGGLPAGSYYISTYNNLGYMNEVHASPVDQVCGWCSVTQLGTAIGIKPPQQIAVNFALRQGGSITGTIRNAVGQALQNVGVQVYADNGNFAGSGNSNASGFYTVGGLPTGNYYLRTYNSQGYINEVFDNITCLGCSVTSGTKVGVKEGAATTGRSTTRRVSMRGPGTQTGPVCTRCRVCRPETITAARATRRGSSTRSTTTSCASRARAPAAIRFRLRSA
jgi:hypothetical protein